MHGAETRLMQFFIPKGIHIIILVQHNLDLNMCVFHALPRLADLNRDEHRLMIMEISIDPGPIKLSRLTFSSGMEMLEWDLGE